MFKQRAKKTCCCLLCIIFIAMFAIISHISIEKAQNYFAVLVVIVICLVIVSLVYEFINWQFIEPIEQHKLNKFIQKSLELKFKYKIELASLNASYSYVGESVREVHHAIDSDRRWDDDPYMRTILKEGYFGEFVDFNYHNKEYTIDNCMLFKWTVEDK